MNYIMPFRNTIKMDKDKVKRLLKDGWKSGTPDEFLDEIFDKEGEGSVDEKITTSDRGFDACEPIITRWGGKIRVYESSNAMEPCIWLNVDPAIIQLTLREAQTLAIQLQQLVRDHYQMDYEEEE